MEKKSIIADMGVLLKQRKMLKLLNELESERALKDSVYEVELRLKWLEHRKVKSSFKDRKEFLNAHNLDGVKFSAVTDSKEWKESRSIIQWCKRDGLVDLDEEGGVNWREVELNVNGARFISWPYFINAIGDKLGKFWSIALGILGGLITSPLVIEVLKVIWVSLQKVILKQ
jgi:hypothetical protein